MNLRQQLRAVAPALWTVYATLAAMVLGVVLAKYLAGVSTADLVRDPAVVAGTHPFVGWLSNVGIVLWCSTAAVCLFSAFIIRTRAGDRETRSFLLCAGLLTSLFLLDDFFLIHDEVFPRYLGVHENLFYGAYALLAVLFVFRFRELIRRSEFVLLVLALLMFALSIGADFLSSFVWFTGLLLFEDSLKLFGIAAWFLYFVRLCKTLVSRPGP